MELKEANMQAFMSLFHPDLGVDCVIISGQIIPFAPVYLPFSSIRLFRLSEQIVMWKGQQKLERYFKTSHNPFGHYPQLSASQSILVRVSLSFTVLFTYRCLDVCLFVHHTAASVEKTLTPYYNAFKKTVFWCDLSAFVCDKDPDKNLVLLLRVGRNFTHFSHLRSKSVVRAAIIPQSYRRFPLLTVWLLRQLFTYLFGLSSSVWRVRFTTLNRIIWLFTRQTWLYLSLDKLSNYLPSTCDKLLLISTWVCSRWQLNSHLTFP